MWFSSQRVNLLPAKVCLCNHGQLRLFQKSQCLNSELNFLVFRLCSRSVILNVSKKLFSEQLPWKKKNTTRCYSPRRHPATVTSHRAVFLSITASHPYRTACLNNSSAATPGPLRYYHHCCTPTHTQTRTQTTHSQTVRKRQKKESENWLDLYKSERDGV